MPRWTMTPDQKKRVKNALDVPKGVSYSIVEIADIMQINESSVRGTLERALYKLKIAYGKQLENEAKN